MAAELEHTPRKGTKIGDATFIYHYSDFRHDAKKVLLKYFDAMLYFSNWGTRRLMFRLPAELVDAKAIAKYAYESQSTNDHLSIKQQGAYMLIEYLRDDDDGGDWMEATDYDLGDLSQVRNDILQKYT